MSLNEQTDPSTAHPTRAILHARGTVEVQRHGDVRPDHDPVHTIRAGGQHHALVMANREHGVPRAAELHPTQTACTGRSGGLAVISHYTGRGGLAGGVTRDPGTQPASTITGTGNQSVVLPYAPRNHATHADEAPAPTVTTIDRMAIVVPCGGTRADSVQLADREAAPTLTASASRAVVWTDEDIDSCRFRMFSLGEIAGAMQLEHQANGSPYVVSGNKREQMRQYGNAVTPPAMAWIVERLLQVTQAETFTDMFCGAGGSSLGAEIAGGRLRMALNHWDRAIQTHAANFQDADHDCADVSLADPRRYPSTDILMASPECVNHSLAKGAQRRKPQAASLFADGPAGDAEQDKSRATMWDVVRFAEAMISRGHPYKAIIVENVVDAFKWGANDDGQLFAAWLNAMDALGYHHEIVWMNSMFAHGPAGLVPQSRDRMYPVFWLKGIRRPNLQFEPVSWCVACEKVTRGQQAWKKPAQRPWGRYGPQYFYTCPDCRGTVLPGAAPAAAIINEQLPATVIGERTKPLAPKTRERIRRGLQRLADEPFAIRLLRDGQPKPVSLPLVTLTARHDMAMVIPVAGNTHENSPGNRARAVNITPLATVNASADRALIAPPMGNVDARPISAPAPTQTTTTRAALVQRPHAPL